MNKKNVLLIIITICGFVTGCNILGGYGNDSPSSQPDQSTLLGFSAQEIQQIVSVAQSEQANLSLPAIAPAMSFYRFDIKNEKGGKRLSTIISYQDAIGTPTYGPESTAKVLLYEAKKVQLGYDFDYFEFEKKVATATVDKIVKTMTPYFNNPDFLLNSAQDLEQVPSIKTIVDSEALKIIAPAKSEFKATPVSGASSTLNLDLKPRFKSLGSTVLYNMIFNKNMRDFFSKLRTDGLANSSLVSANIILEAPKASVRKLRASKTYPADYVTISNLGRLYGKTIKRDQRSDNFVRTLQRPIEYSLKHSSLEIAFKDSPTNPGFKVQAKRLSNNQISVNLMAIGTSTVSIPITGFLQTEKALFLTYNEYLGNLCCVSTTADYLILQKKNIPESKKIDFVYPKTINLTIFEGSKILSSKAINLEKGIFQEVTLDNLGPVSNFSTLNYKIELSNSSYLADLKEILTKNKDKIASESDWKELKADLKAGIEDEDKRSALLKTISFKDSDLETNMTSKISGTDGNWQSFYDKYKTLATGTFTFSNSAPEISSNGGNNTAAVSIPENTTTISTVTATDYDPGQTITYSISGGADKDKFSIDSSTGTLTFKTAPNFESPADADTNNTYIVEVKADDGNGGTATQTITVSVTDVAENTPPSITSNSGGTTAAVSVAENQTNATTVTATDSDSGQTITYSVSGGADKDKFSIDSSTGVLTFKTAPNFESPADADTNNTYIVEVKADDGNGGTDTQTITVSVTDVAENTPPSITSNSGGTTAAVSVAENQTNATTVTATDSDSGQTITYSISGGADKDKFSIDSSTGVFTFKTAPNFESPADADTNNTYIVEVKADDGNGGTDTQTITVSVSDANDAPIITHFFGDSPIPFPVLEGTTVFTTITATDEDSGQTLSYDLTGGADKNKFTINSSGVLAFINAPVALAPSDSNADNVYIVEVTVSDGNGGTDKQEIHVAVGPLL